MAAAPGDPLPPALACDPVLPPRLMVFDGICVLCSGAVRFVLEHERAPEFAFTPVQSPLGQRVLAALGQPLDGNESMVILAEGRAYLKSEAILRLVRTLKAPWRWSVVFRVAPRRWRDRAYDCLARNRYNVFGRYDTCMVPDADLRKRFVE